MTDKDKNGQDMKAKFVTELLKKSVTKSVIFQKISYLSSRKIALDISR